MTVKLTDSNFAAEVLEEKGVVLVDFWASWCGPCRMIAPVIEEVAEETAGRAKIGKLDVDQNQATAGRYGVMSIPTMIIYKDGKPVDKVVGVVPKATLTEKLEKWIA